MVAHKPVLVERLDNLKLTPDFTVPGALLVFLNDICYQNEPVLVIAHICSIFHWVYLTEKFVSISHNKVLQTPDKTLIWR